jgi:hypothetical protein
MKLDSILKNIQSTSRQLDLAIEIRNAGQINFSDLGKNLITLARLTREALEEVGKNLQKKINPEEIRGPFIERILKKAKKEAVSRSHSYVGVEHTILALLSERSFTKILNSLKIKPSLLRDETELDLAPGEIKRPIHEIGLTPRMQMIIANSRKQATLLGASTVDMTHFFLAMLKESSGPGKRIFDNLQVDYSEAREVLTGSPS